MAKGILLVAFDYTNAHADEFHDWYDLEHVPERQRVPGFGLCERWISVANPKQAVATYDLDSLAVLDTAPYRAIACENLSVWSKRVDRACAQRLIRFDGEQTLPGDADSPAWRGRLAGERDECRRRSTTPNSTNGTTTSTFPRWPPCPACCPPAGSAIPRARIAILRCITWRRPR